MSSTTSQDTRPKRRTAADRKAKAQARLRGGNSPAIRPGMQGGQYRPLNDGDLARIHEAALTILENTGIGDPLPELLDIVLPLGAELNAHGRLCFPRSLVEDIIAGAARGLTSIGKMRQQMFQKQKQDRSDLTPMSVCMQVRLRVCFFQNNQLFSYMFPLRCSYRRPGSTRCTGRSTR